MQVRPLGFALTTFIMGRDNELDYVASLLAEGVVQQTVHFISIETTEDEDDYPDLHDDSLFEATHHQVCPRLDYFSLTRCVGFVPGCTRQHIYPGSARALPRPRVSTHGENGVSSGGDRRRQVQPKRC